MVATLMQDSSGWLSEPGVRFERRLSHSQSRRLCNNKNKAFHLGELRCSFQSSSAWILRRLLDLRKWLREASPRCSQVAMK